MCSLQACGSKISKKSYKKVGCWLILYPQTPENQPAYVFSVYVQYVFM
jgi:hypothetical protein